MILVAKNDQAHARLAAQFDARSIEKEYFALVAGRPERDRDVIDEPIGVHPRQREKMAIRRDTIPEAQTSRPAETFYEVRRAVRRLRGGARRCPRRAARTRSASTWTTSAARSSATGSTAAAREITRGEIRRDPTDTLVLLDRQALHARRLRFTHPATGQPWKSKPRCRPTWRPCWPSCGSTGR